MDVFSFGIVLCEVSPSSEALPALDLSSPGSEQFATKSAVRLQHSSVSLQALGQAVTSDSFCDSYKVMSGRGGSNNGGTMEVSYPSLPLGDGDRIALSTEN